MAKAVRESMVYAGGGAIINISSVVALIGEPCVIACTASKFAFTGMTKVAAKEFGPHSIRANSIHPGVAVTPILDLLPEREAFLSAAIAGTAVHRAGRPEDVSNAVHFLASDKSPFINGVALVVGMH
ncbi:SDR family NAD(P)-dependent oxidoreductase [Pigmentiphaga sp. YJ18]|uniref:SDR family NAD(P)-dependent oxidoreductase n=1 Tax=Pigmentiphaga sp. YJ18 TaxID=3134907 RepID=UPI004053F247